MEWLLLAETEWYSIAKDVVLLSLGGFGTVVSAVASYIIRQHNKEYAELRSGIKTSLEAIEKLERNQQLHKINHDYLREDHNGLRLRHDSLSKRFGRMVERLVRVETKHGYRVRDDDDDSHEDIQTG